MKNDYPKRGDIYWIELDPTVGTETRKKRPCLILSNNIHNKKMPRVIAAPITSQIKTVFPFEMVIQVKDKQGKVMLDQLRCFDKQRLQGKYCELDLIVMKEIEDRLKGLLDLL
jgi:mRNA interferase MazF